MEDFTVIEIGKPIPGDQEFPQEGCHYSYDASGHWLHYIYNDPSGEEIENIQKGEAQFGLYVDGNALFLLHKFGYLPWSDSPYSWWRVTPEYRKVPWIDRKLHAPITVVLIDQKTKIVRALRFVTFTKEFTLRLHEAILNQTKETWDPDSHNKIIDRTYRQFSSEDLARKATIRCLGGITDEVPAE
jgi:hypothetical protein